MTKNQRWVVGQIAVMLLGSAGAARADNELGFSPDGKRVIGVDGGKAYVWDIQSEKLVLTQEKALGYAGNLLVGIGEQVDHAYLRAINTWTEAGKIVKSCEGDFQVPFTIRPDGRRVAARLKDKQDHSKLVAVDLDTCKQTVLMDGADLTHVSYSPDGKYLAYSSTSGIAESYHDRPLSKLAIIDAETGAERAVVQEAQASRELPSKGGRDTCPSSMSCLIAVNALAWTSDDRLVAAGYDRNGLEIWTLDPSGKTTIAAGLERPSDGGAPDHVSTDTLLVTPDGKWLAVGVGDGLAWYKYPSLSFNVVWTGGSTIHLVHNARYSPDGKMIALLSRGNGGSCPTCALSPTVHILDANASSSVVLHAFPTEALKFKKVGGEVETSDANANANAQVVAKPVTAAPPAAAKEVSQPASHAAVWMGKFMHPDDWKHDLASPAIMKMALDQGNECHAAVEAARKAGVSDATPIDFNTYQSGVTSPASLADVDAKICQETIKRAGGVVSAQGAAKDAAYGPFLKVLSADKAKIFVDQNMADGVSCTRRCSGMYGHGMKRLVTPSDFASSDVWYYYVIHREGPTTWEVEGWTFSGMKKTGSYSKTGAGEDPPASAFH